MTNQEVNEFMQRFLDDDLNEEELEALMEHIRLNPASAVLFERLQRLDDELDQLPKVVPPMSIVDSILPRLDLAGLVEPPPVISTLAAADLPNRAVPVVRRTTLRDRINYRVLGGVVAAGIVLTLFFTNYGPQMSFETANDDSASDTMANQVMVAESNAILSKKNAPAQSQSVMEGGVGEAQDQATTDEAPSATIFEAPVAPDSDMNPSIAYGAAEAPAPWVDNGTASTNNEESGSGSGASGYEPKAESAPSTGDTTNDEAITDERGQSTEGLREQPAEESTDDRLLFTTTKSNLPTVVSPDEQLTGTVTAITEGGQQIIITDKSGAQVYESAVYPGSLSQLTWSPDSTQLHFEATENNKSTIHMTIHVDAQTETIKKAE